VRVYLLRRLASAVSTVAVVSFVAFTLFGHSLDPTYPLVLNPDQTRRHALQKQYHLTDPILERYWLWVKALPTDGFGTTVFGSARIGSAAPGNDIGPSVWSSAIVSGQLVAVSMVVVLLGSVVLGTLAAYRPRGSLDVVLRLLTYLSVSLPAFLVATLLIRWLGPTGIFLGGPPGGGVVHWLRQMTLPVLTMAIGLVGLYARHIRSAMLVTLREPYVGVARGKGASELRVVMRHALRNSLVPFVSLLTLDFGAIVGTSLVADWSFGLGGLAALLTHALGDADPFLLTAIVVVLSGVVVTFMFLADLALGWLDPRLRSG
jgi:peptide/nickel transport system permease protein